MKQGDKFKKALYGLKASGMPLSFNILIVLRLEKNLGF